MADQRRPHIPATLRRQVRARAGNRCEYCQCPESFSLDTFHIDHVQPVSGGGANTLANLACACNNCNLRKLAAMLITDPLTQEQVPLFNPRAQDWKDHFAWSEDTLSIIPLTATGRATEARLQLNRAAICVSGFVSRSASRTSLALKAGLCCFLMVSILAFRIS